MSACKAGCGTSTPNGLYLCDSCAVVWQGSKELARAEGQEALRIGGAQAGGRAMADFCSRMRAERLSEQQGTWPAVPKEAR